MTIDEAIYKQHALCDNLEYMQEFNTIILSALLAQQERENPQPLTVEELQKAKNTVEQIYEEYLFSETDIVNLRSYDEELQQVHTVLENLLAYRYSPKEANDGKHPA